MSLGLVVHAPDSVFGPHGRLSKSHAAGGDQTWSGLVGGLLEGTDLLRTVLERVQNADMFVHLLSNMFNKFKLYVSLVLH